MAVYTEIIRGNYIHSYAIETMGTEDVIIIFGAFPYAALIGPSPGL